MRIRPFIDSLSYVKYKAIYFPTLIIKGLIPFGFNLVVASFFLVMFNAAETGDWMTIWSGLKQTSILVLIFAIFGGAINFLYEYMVIKTSAGFRSRTFNKLQRLTMNYQQQCHSGDLTSRVTNDLKTMEGVYNENLLNICSSLTSGIGALVVMLLLNWQVASLVIGLGLVFAVINSAFVKPLRKTSDQVQTKLAQVTEKLSDLLASVQVTRVFGLEARLTTDFIAENDQVLAVSQKRVTQNALMNSLNFFTSFMGFGGFLVIGGYFVLNGTITFGEVVFMVQMHNNVNQLFTQIGNQITQMQTSLAGANRVLELLDAPEEPWIYQHDAYPRIQNQNNDANAIAVQNVDFQYDNNVAVLNKLNFNVPQGKMYALVGPSGGGKSTILKMMLGFYPPGDGNVFVSGRSILTSPLERVREDIAYVPQDCYLFSGTIAENIGYGMAGATNEQIEKAAKAAFAHDFIMELPEGYHSKVGERGVHLSGGQRQRVAIARAILKDAPVLLLDEATSALDSESEKLVQKALARLMVGKTTLVVAHRLSTIEQADQILVIDQGQVAESGTHGELLEDAGSVYTRLYDLQFASG